VFLKKGTTDEFNKSSEYSPSYVISRVRLSLDTHGAMSLTCIDSRQIFSNIHIILLFSSVCEGSL
jgi:hypothetical protein